MLLVYFKYLLLGIMHRCQKDRYFLIEIGHKIQYNHKI